MESVKDYMDKKAVAQVLEQIAAFLELKSENPFRIRAFRTAARAIVGFPGDLRQSLEDRSLASAKGIGPATLQIVAELVNTGRASMLEELRAQIPPGLVEMLEVSGLGVAKIRQIHKVLGIDSLPELEAAAHDGRLTKLPRFGPRTSENILKAIAFLRQASAYRLLHHASDEAEGLRAALERLPGVTSAIAAGDVRRRAEVAACAAAKGYALNGAALWRGSQFIATPDEQTFYQALGLSFIPAELREGTGEVAAAARDALPRLVEQRDIRGFLHCHTSYSDGSNTVEELAQACKAAGYDYLGVTDHSQAAAYAGGLRPDDLARQADEIDQVNARLQGFRVLKGIEADILQDGSVDYDERVLERLDFVIASVHSRFNMGEKEMTARMLTAMDNPYLTIIGHPTGRLLLSRDPYPVDMDAVIEKAAATGVALEINADPHRLDLDWRLVRQAREGGVAISIGADAHSVPGLGYMEFGIGMARKGWLGPDDILNARPVGEFVAYARSRRR
jgi:DNA polymerase (family 10)